MVPGFDGLVSGIRDWHSTIAIYLTVALVFLAFAIGTALLRYT